MASFREGYRNERFSRIVSWGRRADCMGRAPAGLIPDQGAHHRRPAGSNP